MGRVSVQLGQRVYLDANIVIYAVEGLPTYLDQIRALMTAVNASEIIAVTSELTLAERKGLRRCDLKIMNPFPVALSAIIYPRSAR